MIPHKTPFFLRWLYPSLMWRMRPDHKELFLTFDDGPVPGPTEFVLKELSKASAKATFFCIGDNIQKNPSVFNAIVKDGHTIGNHSFNHLNGWKTTTREYLANVKRFEEILRQFPGLVPTRLFRPPYGRITRGQIKALSDYRIIMWDVLSQDYNDRLTGEQCLRGTLKATTSGSIIVFHDSYKSEKNMTYTLPRLIDYFGDKGYTFRGLQDAGTREQACG